MEKWGSFMNQTIVFLDRKSLIADIVVVNKVRLSAGILAQAPGVKMIAVPATGTDNVDLAYCRAHGIVVSTIRGYAVHTVPEHAFM